MSFLLDTDICSAYLKGEHRVGNRTIQYGGRLYVSAITAGELYTWVPRSKASPRRLVDLLAFFKDVKIIDVDDSVAANSGKSGRRCSMPAWHVRTWIS
ncbi:type II toxin-antitoxin system VapC family toxin [Singulisphaera rosea]